jgi:hypothetical protein
MKTYTAAEFEVEFYRAMHEWVAGGKVGIDPRENWEFLISEGKWRSPRVSPSFVVPRVPYRWKPAKKRTVIIDGQELVAPETVKPPAMAEYFILLRDYVASMYWDDTPAEEGWLKSGIVFLEKKDAQAMLDVQRKQRLGGAA